LKENAVTEDIRRNAKEILNATRKEEPNYSKKDATLIIAIQSLQDFKDNYKVENNNLKEIPQTSWYECISEDLSWHCFKMLDKDFRMDQSTHLFPLLQIFENPELKDFLINIMTNIISDDTIWSSIYTITGLAYIAVDSKKVIKTLKNYIDKTDKNLEYTFYNYAAYTLGKIDRGNKQASSIVFESIQDKLIELELDPYPDYLSEDRVERKKAQYLDRCKSTISSDLQNLSAIAVNKSDTIEKLYGFLKDTKDQEIQLEICQCILSFDPLNALAISYLVYLFAKAELNTVESSALISLIEYLGWKEALNYTIQYFVVPASSLWSSCWSEVIDVLKTDISTEEISGFISFINPCHLKIFWEFRDLLWHFSHEIKFQDFCRALESEKPDKNIHELENQFMRDIVQTNLDLSSDRSDEIRCIVVDIRQLEQESDPNAIAEEIGIRIFDSLGLEIPEIQRVSNLKRELTNLQRKLDVKKIAIALYCREENPTIGKLCHNLKPIQINLFTGEQTTEKLIARIQNWLSEI